MEELAKKKDEIEKEVDELMAFLNSCGPDVGISGKLIDSEGFPRSDIDIYAVRRARNRIAILNTDYSMVMKEIEEKLFDIHSKEKNHVPIEKSEKKSAYNFSKDDMGYPFGLIDSVLEGSPAFQCGIRMGDIILGFENLRSESEVSSQEESKNLIGQLSSIVLSNIDKTIKVTVLRSIRKKPDDLLSEFSSYIDGSDLSYQSLNLDEFEIKSLDLVPTKWDKPGYLGCHVAFFHKLV
ncbi:PDZ domain-containing p27 like 26S proteasomal subunit [Cryptosporidium canis]|uniref:PDZ domain-containing p27 like 26S proteasomal subunit n=1 Tax=Cryptosporidium canis TaxID=195482 RepID=A0A9D5DKA4_9CRYT|nr:PDZ domain-containing p27 like 26S proteasomal subunit [Cryptosporidium canis]